MEKTEKDPITFENWSSQQNTAAIFQIVEKYTVKDNKASIVYGIRVSLIFGEIETENPKALVLPLAPKLSFANPDLAFKFIQKHLTPVFGGTSVAVVLIDRAQQMIGTYDLTKIEEDEPVEVKVHLEHPEMISEGTLAVN